MRGTNQFLNKKFVNEFTLAKLIGAASPINMISKEQNKNPLPSK